MIQQTKEPGTHGNDQRKQLLLLLLLLLAVNIEPRALKLQILACVNHRILPYNHALSTTLVLALCTMI